MGNSGGHCTTGIRAQYQCPQIPDPSVTRNQTNTRVSRYQIPVRTSCARCCQALHLARQKPQSEHEFLVRPMCSNTFKHLPSNTFLQTPSFRGTTWNNEESYPAPRQENDHAPGERGGPTTIPEILWWKHREETTKVFLVAPLRLPTSNTTNTTNELLQSR